MKNIYKYYYDNIYPVCAIVKYKIIYSARFGNSLVVNFVMIYLLKSPFSIPFAQTQYLNYTYI